MASPRKSSQSNSTTRLFNVADTQPFQPLEIYDAVSLFNLGMDSGSNPLLLKKNQLAFLSNGTVRGGFANSRTAYSKNHLTINYPSDAVRDAILEGLFQGAGYYQPDSGSQSLFAQIAGRLFQFQVTGNTVDVFERTISGDPNPAASTQAWMWQAENFLIVNDGASLPVFFDGATSRRSYGPSVKLNDVSAISQANTPPIGTQITLTLSAPYTGLFNVPILFHGAFYQAIENTAGYDISLTNITDTPGTVYPAGTEVVIRNDVFGVSETTVPNSIPGNSYAANGIGVTITMTLPFTGSIGDTLILFGKIWRVESIAGKFVFVRNSQAVTIPATPTLWNAGDIFIKASATAPNVIIGVVADTTTFTAAGTGSASQATLTQVFSGPANTPVFIGDKQYTATAIPSGPPGTSLTVINLSDPEGIAYPVAFPQDLLSVPELPAGRMGAYGLTQNWMSLVDGLSYIASDVSRGPSGTYAYNFRDAVLKTADLTFRGGAFAIPGAGNFITSITFIANLDVALGQGSLQLGTAKFMASNLAPFDYSNPPATGPILTYSLLGYGPLGQNSTISANSDIFFRSTIGLGSFILARRNFVEPGNTPISHEMERVINFDNQTLLPYGSAVTFDNRKLDTCTPSATSQGVVHTGLIATNYDSISSMQEKQPPVYDGLWTGLNVLQLVSGLFNGTERCFAFTFNVTLSRIELYEIFPSDSRRFFDDGSVPITWSFETASLFLDDVKPSNVLARLTNGEFAVDDVVGRVNFQIYYKADQGCWTPWHSFSICSDTAGAPQYFPRLGIGEPTSENCDAILNTTTRDAYTFQFKWVITGRCRFLRARFQAVTLPTPKFPAPICNVGQ